MRTKMIATVLAVATLVTAVVPEAVLANGTESTVGIAVESADAEVSNAGADDILNVGNSGNIVLLPIAEGQELGDAVAALDTTMESDESDGIRIQNFYASQGEYIPSGNEYTYIGVLEDAKKRQVFIRIPYWFVNAFPKTKWYFVGKKKLQVKISVQPKSGMKGKKFTKKLTLSRDSRLWLGGWGDYDNELIVSPWIQKAFKQEAVTVSDGKDPDLGNCKVIVVRCWKNKTAFSQRKNPIIKVIHYVNYNHYRVTTTNKYTGDDNGESTIIID